MAHYTVLLHEVVAQLAIAKNDVVIDGTINGGGHSELIARHLSKDGVLVGIDLDQDGLDRSSARLSGVEPQVHLVLDNFRNIDAVIQRLGIRAPNKILLDLGWSRNQIDDASRGFSFMHDGPLAMTYRKIPGESDFTAHMIVNEWDESVIADILYGYGEERYARRIAKGIVEAREKEPIVTTSQLQDIVARSVPISYRTGRLNPATKTFQALRIAVNDELGALESVLPKAIDLLAPGGRLAVISFHSIEDRIVKNAFKDAMAGGEGTVLTKKPIVPTSKECAENPASRSAKLRLFEKITE